MKGNKKALLAVLLVAVLMLSFASTALGAGSYVTQRIWKGSMPIYNNGDLAQLGTDPIIIDGTTYLPVRAMANLLGKNISWGGSVEAGITITDKNTATAPTSADLTYLTNQVSVKQTEINQLKEKIASLEASIKPKDDEITKLKSEKSDIQKKLDDANARLSSGNYYYNNYGYNYGYTSASSIQNTLNSSYTSSNIGGRVLTFSYAVSDTQYGTNTGRYYVNMNVNGNATGVDLNTLEFRNFLQTYVVPVFRNSYYNYNNYNYNNYGFDNWAYNEYYRLYGYSPTSVSDTNYRAIYFNKYGYYPDYNYGYYNYNYYPYNSINFSVYDTVNAKTHTLTANSSGVVQ